MDFMKKIKEFQARLPVIFIKEKRQFIAYTPALDLSTSGSTLAQAEKRFIEAARLFIEECQAMGTLDEVLKELGWEKKRKLWNPPGIVGRQIQQVKVPIVAELS